MFALSMLDLCTGASQDVYVKLILSSLDYTRDGISRLLLAKALTATTEVNTISELVCTHGLRSITCVLVGSHCFVADNFSRLRG